MLIWIVAVYRCGYKRSSIWKLGHGPESSCLTPMSALYRSAYGHSVRFASSEEGSMPLPFVSIASQCILYGALTQDILLNV